MRFVDTNVFLRLMVNDDPVKADACESLFRKAIAGDETLATSDMVIAEIIWVLESYYELKKSDIRENVEKILNTRNLHCPNREIIISALSIYVEKNIDFIDAYNAFMLKRDEIYEIYSYDKHFDRVGWIKRIEPRK
ncbi:PIN domain-containing protein [Thermodesulfobacteriota bacterium]|jgi:predicted nucleic acid-binding protein